MFYFIEKNKIPIDWSIIPALPINKVLWSEDTGIHAQGQLCYDDTNLYVHMSAEEKHIRAEYTAPLSPVHEDSCLEFFFKTSDSNNYFNFEINPKGCMCIQYGPSRAERINIVKYDALEYFDIHISRLSDGWEIYYKIPLSFIRLFQPDIHFNGSLYGNMYKCGDKTVKEHYLAWSPVDVEKPDFHRPEFFGELRFQ